MGICPPPELAAALLDALPDATIATTPDGTITAWNGGAERLFGFTADDAIGRPVAMLAPTSDRAIVDAQLAAASRGRGTDWFVAERLTSDGRAVTVSIAITPVRAPGGAIIAVAHCMRETASPSTRMSKRPADPDQVATEIAARSRAEDALRLSEEAQRLLVALNDATRQVHNTDDLVAEFARRVALHFNVARCTYGEIDAAQHYVIVARDYADGVVSVVGRHRLDDFGPSLIRELKTGQTIAVADVVADPRTSDDASVRAFAAIDTRALLCVPLVKEGRFVALFVLHHPRPRAWTTADVTLMEQIAERTWFAVENARAEAALRESREVLGLAMRAGQMGAWSRDLTTGTVWWSRELEELFGLPPGGFGGTRDGFVAFIHEDDRQRLEEAVTNAIATRTDYVVEFRFRRGSDGPWRWMEGRGRVVYGVDGVAASLYGIGIDITERRRVEDALSAAHSAAMSDAQRLQLALSAARLGDWSWDTGTDVVTLSPRAAEIFDVPPGAHTTWSMMRQLLHPEDRDATRLAVLDAIDRHQDYAAEYRLVNGGRERWVAASGRASYDDTGHVAGMFGVVQDITRDRLLLRLDDAVRPLTDSEAITYTAASILGQHLRVHRCAYAVVEDDEDTFVLTGNYTNGVHSITGRYRFRQFGAECLRLMRDGEPYVVGDSRTDSRITEDDRTSYEQTAIRAVICVPIRKSGHFVAAMAVHMAQPRSWRSDEVQLVQQVASRCWESLERARVEGERRGLLDAAEAANRAKDEFLAMLGHELRNPLSPIVTALQLMRLRDDSTWMRERSVIERQVGHLTRLVDDLLDVSRITRGKVELRPETVDLGDIVARALEVASPLLEAQHHAVSADVAPGLMITVDPGRLTQVVSNLVTNAAKYTPRAGRIAIVAARDGDRVELRIRDTGMGIPPDVLPRVFDMFVQGPQAMDRARGGLGLGLTIVKSLVERHGGSVSAHSDGPGRGSEFVVRLPAAHVLPADDTPARGAHTVAIPPAPGLRVLVVDDNQDAALTLADALSVNGYRTRVAHDGPDAVRLAQEFAPDVAILDIGLPVMDGYELAQRLRELPRAGGLRLLAVTGYGQESDRRRATDAGFQHHFVKPVDLDVLLELLATLNPAGTAVGGA